MKKIIFILGYIVGFFSFSFSQEFEYLDCKVSLFDNESDLSLCKTNNNNFSFIYSNRRQRFYVDFSADLKPCKYYKILFKNLQYSGKESPILFVRFENNGKTVNQTFCHLNSRFYVFITPENFDKVRLIFQYQNADFSFSSFILGGYNKKEHAVGVDISDLKTLINGDDYTSYDKQDFLKGVFDSLIVCKWNLGNYYNKNFWVGKNHTRTQERWIYGYFWLQDLVSAYMCTGNVLYLNKGKEIINISRNAIKNCYSEFNLKGKTLCFGNDSAIGVINKPMIWHDETVARRLFSCLDFYEYIDSMHDPLLKEYLDGEMRQMASVLATNDFYSQDNNHGMFQSLSLLAYSCFYKDSLALVYQDIALSRLFDYFLFSFTDEGVSREHTPTYHFTISNRFGSFLEFYKKYFPSSKLYDNIYEDLHKKFELSKIFSYAILMPNNCFPPVGDCIKSKNPQHLYPRIFDSDTLNIQKQKNFFFRSGYAIFRDKWDSSNSYYLMFLAAYNHWSHKHCDDLSFILYNKGRDIFIDCGYFGYEKNNSLVDYGNSSFAHNSLVVDDKNLSNKANQDKKYSSVGISKYIVSDEKQFVAGFNKRWLNIEHYRSITHFKDKTTVTDSIVSIDKKVHNFKLLFHLSKDIIPYYDGEKITLSYKGEILGCMEVNTDSVNVHVYYGDNMGNEKYVGYHCESNTTFAPTSHYVIALEHDGFSWNVSTEIILN